MDYTISIENALNNGANDWLLGGVTADASYFHVLTRDNTKQTEWRHQMITRTGMFRSGGPVLADRVSNHLWLNSQSGGILGYAAIETFGGNMYVAKMNSSNQIVIYKYTGTNMNATAAIAKNTGVVSSGVVMSLRVGQFDFGTGQTYAIVTTAGTSTSGRQHFVFQEATGNFITMNWDFPIPYDKTSVLGLAYIGTSNNDTAGYFKSVMRDGYIYKHTQLGYTSVYSTIFTRQKWRNDGNNGGTGASVASIGPDSLYATYTYKRRSKLTISSKNSIPNVGGNSPNAVTFYINEGVSNTYYRYDEPAAGVLSQVVTQFRTTDAPGTTTVMAAGVPSKIISSSGLVIDGNGDITANKITANGVIDGPYSAARTFSDFENVSLAAAVSGSITVTLPTNYFTTAPIIVATVTGSSALFAYTSAITASSFTLGIRRGDGGAAVTGTYTVHYHAIQN